MKLIDMSLGYKNHFLSNLLSKDAIFIHKDTNIIHVKESEREKGCTESYKGIKVGTGDVA
jgi:hypothetical protein